MTTEEMELERAAVRLGTHSLRLRLLEARAAQARGERGERGPQGPPGPKGDKPAHEWQGTALRFEEPSGEWGELVELRGPRGERGGFGGGGSTTIINQGGGGTGNASFVPTIIRAGDTFTVPIDTQVLWSSDIDIEGILEIDGLFIQVD